MSGAIVMNLRQQRILETLAQTSALSTLDLARALQVSDQTIRRDLKPLAEEGVVEKFHGGVRLNTATVEPPFTQRLRTQAGAKQSIAAAFEATVADGATLFLDNSSTGCFVARLLARRSGLTIITMSLEAARILAEGGSSNRIILPAGELRTSDMTIVGRSAIDFAGRFAPDHFVMSVAALSETGDCMDFDLYESEFKSLLMPKAARVVLLVDAAKFATRGLVRSCGLNDIDLLVSDAAPPAWVARAMKPSASLIQAATE